MSPAVAGNRRSAAIAVTEAGRKPLLEADDAATAAAAVAFGESSAANDGWGTGSDAGLAQEKLSLAGGSPDDDAAAAAIMPRLDAPVVVIPPHLWRNATQPMSAVVMRTYLVPTTGEDVLLANLHAVTATQQYLRSPSASREQTRDQLLAATFVYDYTHPTLRTARNVAFALQTARSGSYRSQTDIELRVAATRSSSSSSPSDSSKRNTVNNDSGGGGGGGGGVVVVVLADALDAGGGGKGGTSSSI